MVVVLVEKKKIREKYEKKIFYLLFNFLFCELF